MSFIAYHSTFGRKTSIIIYKACSGKEYAVALISRDITGYDISLKTFVNKKYGAVYDGYHRCPGTFGLEFPKFIGRRHTPASAQQHGCGIIFGVKSLLAIHRSYCSK